MLSMAVEKSNDEKLIEEFLYSCKQFHKFSSSLSMPLYSDEPNLYEYFNLVNQQIEKIEFIISKLLLILKEGKRLHDKTLENENFMSEFQNYFSHNLAELKFFHEDFFIHSRILMDRLALFSSFLFKINRKGELVCSFSGYFKFKDNGKITRTIKEDINKNISKEFRKLMSNTDWYWEYLKKPRDELLVHPQDAKHRLMGGLGFVSGGNSDILDGMHFSQAYPSTIKGEDYNNKPMLRLLIPKLTLFLSDYIEIVKNEAKIQTN